MGVDKFEPFLMQSDDDCGLAALSTALKFSCRPDITIHEVKKSLEWIEGRSNRSDTPWQHERALKKLGIKSFHKQGWTWDELVAANAKATSSFGHPIVCLLRLGPVTWHWAVIIKMTSTFVWLYWGYEFNEKLIERDEFESRYWKPSSFARLLGSDRYAYLVDSGESSPSSKWSSFVGWLYRNIVGRVV